MLLWSLLGKGQLSSWTGIKVLSHFVSVSGKGKSFLDSIFGLQTQFLDRLTSYGQAHDISVATELEQQLNYENGIKGTENHEILFDRRGQIYVKKKAFPGLQKMKQRTYAYNNDGTIKSVTVFENSFSNNQGESILQVL